MPYTIVMNNAASITTEPTIYTVNVVSVGYDVTCTVTRQPGRHHPGKAHVLCTTRERDAARAVREARRMVRIARHCGGL